MEKKLSWTCLVCVLPSAEVVCPSLPFWAAKDTFGALVPSLKEEGGLAVALLDDEDEEKEG